MKPLHTIAIATICAISSATIASCSCSRESKDIDSAAELGQKHAAMLCDTVLSSHELHYRLLNVRSHEWQMRSNGFDSAADSYIASFEAYIKDHNPTLADSIF